MRKSLTTIALLFLGVSATLAQDKKDIFDKTKPVTWLGMDFTGVKLIGDRERYGSMSDVRHLMDAWNDLMIKEKSKFTPAPAIDRRDVEMAIEVTKEHNQNLELIDLFSENKSDYLHLKEADVEQIISDYDFKGKSGIGLMFVVESFSKLNQEAAIWVTFIDMGSNKVILTERMHGEPGGAGMRNYWANAAHNVIERLNRDFPKWKKKYIG